jgi:hypothetical protein
MCVIPATTLLAAGLPGFLPVFRHLLSVSFSKPGKLAGFCFRRGLRRNLWAAYAAQLLMCSRMHGQLKQTSITTPEETFHEAFY